MAFFADTEKFIPKFIWNFKGPHRVKVILKKDEVVGLTLLISKLTSKPQ